jgi:hypothetical protein
MREANTSVVEMKDIDVDTLKALIEYLHIKSVENLDNVALELFKIADKYKIDKLKVI